MSDAPVEQATAEPGEKRDAGRPYATWSTTSLHAEHARLQRELNDIAAEIIARG